MIKWIKETVFNIKMRVKYGNNLERTDNDGKTPLMNATNAREATWLLEHGAKWDAEDYKRNNALWYTNEEVTKTIYDFLDQKVNDGKLKGSELQAFLNHKNYEEKSAYEHISECLEPMEAKKNPDLYTEYTNKQFFLRGICDICDSEISSEAQKPSQSDESEISFSICEPCQQSWVSSYHQLPVVARWSLWDGTNKPPQSDFFRSILTYS